MNLTVLKIGGRLIAEPQELAAVLDYFATLPLPAILVHGGGRDADRVLAATGHTPTMIGGRRITDAATLDVVTMVYAGKVNKTIVAELQKRGCNALGLSGADGNVVRAVKRPVGEIDYGYAGDVRAVDAALLKGLLGLSLTPVLCPITHDGQGQLLNTNADTIANETAKALAGAGYRVSLRYCFEHPGVLRAVGDPNSVIQKITPADYETLKAEGVINGGMIPKLDNAFAALAAGVDEVRIGSVAALRGGGGTAIRIGNS